MGANVLWRSFAGGEITPELYGRLDLTKHQTGLALCRNFHVLPHGPVTRRPGLGYVNEARTSSAAVRLIPFAYSADQTAVLEFGDGYVRFHLNGSTLLEPEKTITGIVGSTVTIAGHGYANGDSVYIGGRFYLVGSAATNTFATFGLDGSTATPSGATAARVYTLTTPYAAAHLFDLHYAQSADVLTLVHPGYQARELSRLGATNWQLSVISFEPTLDPPENVTATVTRPETGIPVTFQRYVVTSVASDGVTESVRSARASASNSLASPGNYNTVAWDAVTGAATYNIYKQHGGSYGYIGQTDGTEIIDDNIAPDMSVTPPQDLLGLNDVSTRRPGAVTYYEQRRWLAGTSGEPQTVWATRNGTETNLTSSVPSRDDDALKFRIAAQQQNAIRHLLPLSDLIALTAGGEFRIFADNAPNITPSSLSIKPQGYSGANNVQPALTSSSILYVQAQGSRVRELAYNWEANAYRSIDISIMAPHLFNGYTLREVAYQRAPDQTLWAVRNDGVLLSLSYVPEQQVYAWAQHTTDGLIESACVVSEGNEDVLYVVVQRTVNGRAARYVERMRSRLFTEQADAFFVDSGLTYEGEPASTFSGLWHLEGCTVDVLADGASVRGKVVSGGQITLDEAASTVHIGLPYTSDMTTLPVALQAPAYGQGATKNVNGVRMRVTASSVVKAGPSFAKLTDFPARAVSDPYGSPPALLTGELRFAIGPAWTSDGAVCVRQTEPLPLTVLSIALDVAEGG